MSADELELKKTKAAMAWLLLIIQFPLFGLFVGLLGLFTGLMLHLVLGLAFVLACFVDHALRLEKKIEQDRLSDLD